MLTLIFGHDNKSLTISISFFSIAIINAVLSNNKFKSYKKKNYLKWY